MPNAAYFRAQAETCRRLAASTSDADAKESLAAMALDFEGEAGKLEEVPPIAD